MNIENEVDMQSHSPWKPLLKSTLFLDLISYEKQLLRLVCAVDFPIICCKKLLKWPIMPHQYLISISPSLELLSKTQVLTLNKADSFFLYSHTFLELSK